MNNKDILRTVDQYMRLGFVELENIIQGNIDVLNQDLHDWLIQRKIAIQILAWKHKLLSILISDEMQQLVSRQGLNDLVDRTYQQLKNRSDLSYRVEFREYPNEDVKFFNFHINDVKINLKFQLELVLQAPDMVKQYIKNRSNLDNSPEEKNDQETLHTLKRRLYPERSSLAWQIFDIAFKYSGTAFGGGVAGASIGVVGSMIAAAATGIVALLFSPYIIIPCVAIGLVIAPIAYKIHSNKEKQKMNSQKIADQSKLKVIQERIGKRRQNTINPTLKKFDEVFESIRQGKEVQIKTQTTQTFRVADATQSNAPVKNFSGATLAKPSIENNPIIPPDAARLSAKNEQPQNNAFEQQSRQENLAKQLDTTTHKLTGYNKQSDLTQSTPDKSILPSRDSFNLIKPLKINSQEMSPQDAKNILETVKKNKNFKLSTFQIVNTPEGKAYLSLKGKDAVDAANFISFALNDKFRMTFEIVANNDQEVLNVLRQANSKTLDNIKTLQLRDKNSNTTKKREDTELDHLKEKIVSEKSKKPPHQKM